MKEQGESGKGSKASRRDPFAALRVIPARRDYAVAMREAIKAAPRAPVN